MPLQRPTDCKMAYLPTYLPRLKSGPGVTHTDRTSAPCVSCVLKERKEELRPWADMNTSCVLVSFPLCPCREGRVVLC